MNNFVQANPGRISGSLKRRAFADTYANRARARQHEHPLGAIADAARAAMLDPGTKYCWKTLGRMISDGVHRPRGGRRERHRLIKNLLAPLASRMAAHRPRIFAYHRFGAKSGNRVLGVAEFRRQLLALQESCEIVTLSEVLARDPATIHRPLAAITVDDGYADFYEFAAPVLRELGLKATLFVTTGFVEGKVHLWPDTIRALLDASVGKSYRLKGFWRDTEIQLDGIADVEAAWSTLSDQLVYTSPSARRSAIADLAESLNQRIDGLDMSPFAPMTWDQLRELRAEGFEIADHSYTHACLSMLSDEALHNELATSKSLLESRMGAPVNAFAYPNGTPRDFDARVIETLRKLGYDCAVMSLPAPVDRERRYEIGRLPGDTDPEHFRRMLEGFGLVSR